MELFVFILIVGVIAYFYQGLRKKYELKADLSRDALIRALESHFSIKYSISTTMVMGADFFIKKTNIDGVACKFKTKKDKTILMCWPEAPGYWARYFLGGYAMFFKGKEVMRDVASFIEANPDLIYKEEI